MAERIEIRPAALEDISAIQNLLKLVWQKTYTPIIGAQKVEELSNIWHNSERLKLDIDRDNMTFLVADNNTRIIATGCLTIYEDQTKDQPKTLMRNYTEAVIGRMYVHPAAQNQGLGKLLLERLLEPLHRGTRLSLTVEPQNKSAIEFYQRHGFKIKGPGSCSEDPHEDVPTLIMTAIKN